MNIHEFQAKLLLAQNGVAVPSGEVCDSAEAAKKIAEGDFFASGETLRWWSNRKFTRADAAKALSRAAFKAESNFAKLPRIVFREKRKRCFGNVLVTKPDRSSRRPFGQQVAHCGSAQHQEGIVLRGATGSRGVSRPIVMASTEGGMDIEEVAATHPEKILKEPIDPGVGLMPYQGRKLAVALGLKGDLIAAGAKVFRGPLQSLVGIRRQHVGDQPSLYHCRSGGDGHEDSSSPSTPR